MLLINYVSIIPIGISFFYSWNSPLDPIWTESSLQLSIPLIRISWWIHNDKIKRSSITVEWKNKIFRIKIKTLKTSPSSPSSFTLHVSFSLCFFSRFFFVLRLLCITLFFFWTFIIHEDEDDEYRWIATVLHSKHASPSSLHCTFPFSFPPGSSLFEQFSNLIHLLTSIPIPIHLSVPSHHHRYHLL